MAAFLASATTIIRRPGPASPMTPTSVATALTSPRTGSTRRRATQAKMTGAGIAKTTSASTTITRPLLTGDKAAVRSPSNQRRAFGRGTTSGSAAYHHDFIPTEARHEQDQDPERSFPRHPQGHLLRRKEDLERPAEDGQGGPERRIAGRVREAPGRDRRPD